MPAHTQSRGKNARYGEDQMSQEEEKLTETVKTE